MSDESGRPGIDGAAGFRTAVVVPARNCPSTLQRVLLALSASDLPRDQWQLIVVDDCSTDATAEIADPFADLVIRLTGGPHGPAFARNHGAAATTAPVVIFIDADVCVHRDTVRRLVDALEHGVDDCPNAPVAVFGLYDTHPAAPGVVSQYRNLLHHYVHWTSAGDVDTFWAGCGAVRRTAFIAAGMFDEQRFPRPQIEDIELGYRFGDRGERILILPEVQGTHLKRWTLGRMLATDFSDRAVPWMRLILERRALGRAVTLNLRPAEKVYTLLAWFALLLMLVSAITLNWRYVAGAGVALLPVLWGNRRLLRWFARERGFRFALAVVPLRLLFYLTSGAGAGWAIVLHTTEKFRRSPLVPSGATL